MYGYCDDWLGIFNCVKCIKNVHYFLSKYMKSMRKHAPSKVSFRSLPSFAGNETENVSAAVNTSLISPPHCFVITPSFVVPSSAVMWKSTRPQIHGGPLIRS